MRATFSWSVAAWAAASTGDEVSGVSSVEGAVAVSLSAGAAVEEGSEEGEAAGVDTCEASREEETAGISSVGREVDCSLSIGAGEGEGSEEEESGVWEDAKGEVRKRRDLCDKRQGQHVVDGEELCSTIAR